MQTISNVGVVGVGQRTGTRAAIDRVGGRLPNTLMLPASFIGSMPSLFCSRVMPSFDVYGELVGFVDGFLRQLMLARWPWSTCC